MAGSPHFRLLVLALSCSGCFTYRPIEAPSPSVGTEVRFEFTSEAARRVEERNPRSLTRGVAKVIMTTADSIGLDVPLPGFYASQRTRPINDTVRVARADLLSVEMKEFSAVKTAIVTGGVGALALLLVDLSGLESGSRWDKPGPGPGERPFVSLTLTLSHWIFRRR
jgi:hypothetical protein